MSQASDETAQASPTRRVIGIPVTTAEDLLMLEELKAKVDARVAAYTKREQRRGRLRALGRSPFRRS